MSDWYYTWKIDPNLWKWQIFAGSYSIHLTKYQKILLGGSFVYDCLLNFTCHTMKFQNILLATLSLSLRIWFVPLVKANYYVKKKIYFSNSFFLEGTSKPIIKLHNSHYVHRTLLHKFKMPLEENLSNFSNKMVYSYIYPYKYMAQSSFGKPN